MLMRVNKDKRAKMNNKKKKIKKKGNSGEKIVLEVCISS